MFAKLIAALFTSGPGVLGTIDSAIAEYRADQNNAEKAHTVAKAVLALTETLAPLISLIK